MGKGINLRIQELGEKLTNDINEADLPPGIVLITLRELLGQVQALNNQAIAAERKTLEKGEKQDGKEIRKTELAEQSVDSDTSKCDKS